MKTNQHPDRPPAPRMRRIASELRTRRGQLWGVPLFAAVGLLGWQLAVPVAGELATQPIFGQEVPGRYKHPAAIEELANGDMYLVYYGGDGEYAPGTAVYGSRRKLGERSWSPPIVVADTPFYSEGNAVVWQAPDGLVWLFYVCRFGETWSTSRILAKVSRDGAHTWSDSFPISFQEGTMVRNRPIVLADGNYLLPIYHETGHDPERTAPDTCSLFLRHDPQTRSWTPTHCIRSRMGNLQPGVVQLTNEHLVCYCRRAGDYGPTHDGWLVRAQSHDGGRTWSEGMDSPFPNPNAAVDFLKLRNGHLILIYNDSMTERTPLTVALSVDGDRSYPHRRNIAEGAGDFAYPYALEARDGTIHVVYTAHERTVIMHATFVEEDLVAANP